MTALTRYMLRQTLLVMVFVAAAFSAAVWLLQSLRLVDLIVNRGLSIGLFLYMAMLILPRFIDVALPIAVFVSVLFVYNKLIAESELVVMRAAGMGSGTLARPGILIGFIGMIVLYVLSLYLTPSANRAFKDLQFEIRNRFATVLIQDGVFNTLSEHLMVYVKDRNAEGELSSLLIYDTRDQAKPVTIFAERGAFVDTPEGPRILMVNGTRQTRERTTGRLSVLTFDKYTLDLAALTDAQGLRERQPDERYFSELLRLAGTDKATPATMVELNLRLARPLVALTMAAIPVACLLTGQFNRRGQSRRVLLAIVLAFLLEILDVGLEDLAGRTNLAVILLYISLLLPFNVALWLLWNDDRRAAPLAATS